MRKLLILVTNPLKLPTSSALRYEGVDSINAKTQNIVSEWDRLGELSSKRREEIEVCFSFKLKLIWSL